MSSLKIEKDQFSVSEAANFLGVSPATLRRWDNSGLLKAQKTLSGYRVYCREDLEKAKIGNFSTDVFTEKTANLEKGLQIDEAAKLIGVSKMTLRRWEAAGKISSKRSLSGYRLFNPVELKQIAKESSFSSENEGLLTGQRAVEGTKGKAESSELSSRATSERSHTISEISHPDFAEPRNDSNLGDANGRFYRPINVSKDTVSDQSSTVFDENNVFGSKNEPTEPREVVISNPLKGSSKMTLGLISCLLLLLGVGGMIGLRMRAGMQGADGSQRYVIPGSDPESSLTGSPIRSGMTDGRGMTDMEASGAVLAATNPNFKLDISVDTSVEGTLSAKSLRLSDTVSQIVMGENLTVSANQQASSRVATIPVLSGDSTFLFTDQLQTLTNKSISGSANTLTNIANSALTNSGVTINTSGTLTGGGVVALGGTITLTGAASGVTSLTAGTDISVSGSTGGVTVSNSSTLSSVTGRGATTTTLVNLDGGIAVDTSNFTVSGTTGAVVSNSTGTFASTLTASNGFIQTTGALNLTSTSGAISSTGLSSATISVASGTLALATATSGDITLTTGAATGLVNVLTGNLKVGNGTPSLTLDGEDAYIEGTLEVDGVSNLAGAVTFGSTTTLNSLTYAWPGSQSSGQVLRTDGSGALTWVDPDSLTVRWNSINDPDGNQALAMAAYTTTWNWATATTGNQLSATANALTTGTLFDLSSTSTAGDGSKLLGLTRSGTNGTASKSNYGLYSAITNTGTTSTNVAGYFSASGATNNYAAIFEAGNVGIGTTGPADFLHVYAGATSFKGASIDGTASNIFSFLRSGAGKGAVGVSGGTNQLVTGDVADDVALYTQSTNKLHLGTSSTARLTVSGANVGIGTTSPGYKLDVSGASLTNTQRLYFNDAGSGDATLLTFSRGTFGNPTIVAGAIRTQMFDGTSSPASSFKSGLTFQVNPGNQTLTDAMTIAYNGNVGIGTTAPTGLLNVYGSTSATTGIRLSNGTGINPMSIYNGSASPNSTYFQWGDNSGWKTYFGTDVAGTFTARMTLLDTGNVGIGTTAPANDLDVSTTASGSVASLINVTNLGTANASGSQISFVQGTSGGVVGLIRGTLDSAGVGRLSLYESNSAGIDIRGSNVGIGTTTPGYKLDVSGSLSSTALGTPLTTASDTHLYIKATYSGIDTNSGSMGTYLISMGARDGLGGTHRQVMGILTVTKGYQAAFQPSFRVIGGSGMSMETVTASSTALDVRFHLSISNLVGGSYTVTRLSQFTGYNTDLVWSTATEGSPYTTNGGSPESEGTFMNGNVGIGTTAPGYLLHAYAASNGVAITAETDSTTNYAGYEIAAGSASAFINTSQAVGYLRAGAGGMEVARFQTSGVLDVNGAVNANAFDVAEMYEVKDNTEPGDLVVQSTSGGPVVEKSNTVYQDSLLGIVSSEPGVNLGGSSFRDIKPNEKPIALVGRVPTKVSTENGPIEPGDYLTSSSTPGVAMKATRPGPTVGKAQESFREVGVGKILVFVNVSYADPNGALAKMSLDENGDLNVPALKVGKLILDPSLDLSGTANAEGTLSFRIMNLEDRIRDLEGAGSSWPVAVSQQLNSLSSQVAGIATDSAELAVRTDDLEASIASTSSTISKLQELIDSFMGNNEGSGEYSSNEVRSSQLASNNNGDDLNLTPPEVLIASGSATLANINVSEKITTLKLESTEATIAGALKSLGETYLGNTTVAGSFSQDGTLSISNGNTINVIGYSSNEVRSSSGNSSQPSSSNNNQGILYLQNSSLAFGVDFFNGKVTIDNTGKMTVTELVADKVILDEQVLGSATIPAGEVEVEVLTTKISDKSKVFVSAQSSSVNAYVSQKTSGQGFRVKLPSASLTPTQFDWLVVDVK